MYWLYVVVFKHKTAYDMRISDWSSDVCSSDLYGVVKLLESEGISVEGQNVVIVGASNIVGKPMALILMARDATVAICHAKTRDLAQFTILADSLVVAAGVPNLILPQMVKTGAIVIDVGINRLPDGSITGDVDFAGVAQKASAITPVPGGVGPMTVTMLLENTIASAELGRAACRERVCQYVSISVVAGSLKKKTKKI